MAATLATMIKPARAGKDRNNVMTGASRGLFTLLFLYAEHPDYARIDGRIKPGESGLPQRGNQGFISVKCDQLGAGRPRSKPCKAHCRVGRLVMATRAARQPDYSQSLEKIGAPEEIRTPNPQIRSLMLIVYNQAVALSNALKSTRRDQWLSGNLSNHLVTEGSRVGAKNWMAELSDSKNFIETQSEELLGLMSAAESYQAIVEPPEWHHGNQPHYTFTESENVH